MNDTSQSFVKFEKIDKSYDGEVLVVKNLNLDIAKGEFVTMLGPSGSGKTTTLMMLAGFETPTNGEIFLDTKPISKIPPYEREIGMVFQNYALFPHMTVAENLSFPLEVRKISKPDIKEKVQKALDMVELGNFGTRFPAQLSGGQQQRVALARALVFEPRLVLMDEPLGALDKNLREQMQYEIKHIHDRIGITVVYVTHDQREALTMSDRIAVINDGKITQLGTPKQIYNAPSNSFVADFIGNGIFLHRTEFLRCSAGVEGGGRDAGRGCPVVDGVGWRGGCRVSGDEKGGGCAGVSATAAVDGAAAIAIDGAATIALSALAFASFAIRSAANVIKLSTAT